MKKIIILMACLGTTFSHAQDVNPKSNLDQRFAYSIGYNMAATNADVFEQMNIDAFIHGFKTALAGKAASLSPEEMAIALTEYRQNSEHKAFVEFQKLAEDNAKQGQSFLAKNAQATGVQVTKSGLQYQVLNKAKGKKPKANSVVSVHYEGRLLDQTVFDSSIARQQPAKFPLDQVIPGWTEGLQLMTVGSKYRFFIPAPLAYAELGSGDAIPPNSTLIFDIELLAIEK